MQNPRENKGFRPHYHFVTGRLAEPSLRSVVTGLADRVGFDFSIGVMPISVAALITPAWLKRHLVVPPEATEVLLPGHCQRNIEAFESNCDVPLRCGPKDLRELPMFFSISEKKKPLDAYNIQIIAEINHAPSIPWHQLRLRSDDLRARGADVIDLGCNPEQPWNDVAGAVAMLVDSGFRVSIDTLDPWEAQQACQAGASLVLSVNSSNRCAAADWGTEVVVIPDTPDDLASMETTIEYLDQRRVPMRLDPILEPVGLGFSASLQRYATVRERFPELPMMMGIGNLTELTDVDSAGVNLLLMGICQELSIHSVLTTEVINWARTSVNECDHARRIVYESVTSASPPKNLSDALVMLRDRRPLGFPDGHMELLAQQIKDNNYRLFAQDGLLHLVSRGLHLSDTDPFAMFAELMQRGDTENMDPSHAFYLGFELAKAMTALQLGKQYEQDQSLDWGYLTIQENHHRLPRRRRPQR